MTPPPNMASTFPGAELTEDEVAFGKAMEAFRRNGRKFPTCSEVLGVLKALGYRKCQPPDVAELRRLRAI